MHSTRLTRLVVFAGITALGLLAANAGAQSAAPSQDGTDNSWRRATPDRGRAYDDRRQDVFDIPPAASQVNPAPQPNQQRPAADDRPKSQTPPPPLRQINTANPRPRDSQEWGARRPGETGSPYNQPMNQRASTSPYNRPAAPRDGVRPVQFQDEVRQTANSPSREQPYEWHPGRDQAPRARQTANTEAPAFNPNTAAPTLAPAQGHGTTPPPAYRAQPDQAPPYRPEPEPNYRNEPPRMANRNSGPPQNRGGEPMFVTQYPNPRGPYRPANTTNTYELPPNRGPGAQPEIVQSPAPSYSGGQPNYQSGPIYDGVTGGFDSNGYPTDGYGYDDGGNGPGGYSHSSECYYNCGGPCEYCSTCCGGPSCPHRWFEEANLFAGVHSFQGGLDQGRSGNFGFQEGINFAGSLWHALNIGYQVGGMAAQSDLSGSNLFNSNNRNNSRSQGFVTAGIFHRAWCNHGWQGGAVFDWLDDRYYSDSQFAQLRAELSYLFVNGHEFGFWGAFNTGQTQVQTINDQTTQFSALDLYALYYRKTVCEGGQARVWGGGTNEGDGLFGADFRIPMSNRWDFNGGFNYVVPKDGPNSGAVNQQAWGISMNIVWYPTRRACGTHNTPFRQLFNVADNNVFIIRQK